MKRLEQFDSAGWTVFDYDPALAGWAAHALPAARQSIRDPSQAHWLRCGGTWFVGVDALPNDARGAIGNGPPLMGEACDFIVADLHLNLPLHRAQVSVCYPGYPQPSPDETPTAYQYRVKRDAAHVDGLLAEGPDRRRYLKEPHAYILGIPLAEAGKDASPLVVWSGSHLLMHEAFRKAFANIIPEEWRNLDITDIYQTARREVFATCERIELPLKPGEACLLHRHLLHGVAPWREAATSGDDGRMIAYFRPEFEVPVDWLVRA